ncbi:MAG: outer membrane protein [Rhizobiaceae bacterium]
MFKRTMALALLLSTSAHAADLVEAPVIEDETPVIENVSMDWSGLRVGVFGGGIHSTGEAELGEIAGVLIPLDVGNGLFPRSIDDDEFGFTGGIGLGYDQQLGNWIGGVEVDGSLTSLNVEHRFSRIDPNPAFPFTGVTTNTTYQTDIDWLATARLRLGYVVSDNLMFYGTGGLAIGEVTNRFRLSIPDFPVAAGGPYTSPDWNESGTETGFVIGAGVEKKLSENLRLTFSIQYVDLGDVNVEGTDPAAFPGEEINYRFDNVFTTAKIGLTFSF